MKFVGVSAPAWTILGPHQKPPAELPEGQEAPGPVVDADLKSKNLVYPRPSTIIFGKAGRFDGQEEATSRPFSAAPRFAQSQSEPKLARPSSSRHGTLTKAKRFPSAREAEMTPAPSHYAPDLSRPLTASKPTFSLAYKQDANTGTDPNPVGPGQYQPDFSAKEVSRHAVFGKEDKNGLKELLRRGESLPGPGAYEPKPERPSTSSTKGTFGFSKRDDLYKAKPVCNPPPERDYDVVQHTIEYKAEKLRGEAAAKHPSGQQPGDDPLYKADSGINGPGTETIGFNGTKKNPPAWKFGSSHRQPLSYVPDYNVGPGEYFDGKYDAEFRPKSRGTFTRGQRRPLAEQGAKTPGVGAYSLRPEVQEEATGSKPKSLLGGPLYSFRGKFADLGAREAKLLPGPGQHDLDLCALAYWRGGVRIGTAQRHPAKKKFFQPGPGAYEIDRSIVASAAIKFPKSKRAPPTNGSDRDVELGPGHYKLKPTVPQMQPHEVTKLAKHDRAQFLNFNV